MQNYIDPYNSTNGMSSMDNYGAPPGIGAQPAIPSFSDLETLGEGKFRKLLHRHHNMPSEDSDTNCMFLPSSPILQIAVLFFLLFSSPLPFLLSLKPVLIVYQGFPARGALQVITVQRTVLVLVVTVSARCICNLLYINWIIYCNYCIDGIQC